MKIIDTINNAPWSIKLSLMVFILYDIFNLIYCFMAKDITLQFLAITSVQVLLLYGVAHKIVWTRDVFVCLYIFLIPILLALLAVSISNTDYVNLFGSIIIVNLLPLGALVLLYTKQSDAWFNQSLKIKDTSIKIQWPVQLVIVIVALVFGFIALLIESKINIPFIKAEHLSHISSLAVKLTIFHLNQTFGLLCAWVLLIVPLGFFLRIWKIYNLTLLTRLIMIGIIFSLIFRDLATKDMNHTLYFSWITVFFIHLFLTTYLVYFSISSGKNVRNYVTKIFTCKKEKGWN